MNRLVDLVFAMEEEKQLAMRVGISSRTAKIGKHSVKLLVI